MSSAWIIGLALSLVAEVSAPEPQWPDLSGRWARAQRTTSLVQIPVLGETPVTTVVVTVVDVTQTGAALELTEEVCAIESDSVKGVIRAKYPPAFLSAASGGRRPVKLEQSSRGLRWIEPEAERTIGAGDEDGDGNPGVTVVIEGFVDGEVYVRQRGWQSAIGTVLDPKRVAGKLQADAEQQVLGASRDMLRSTLPSRPDPDGGAFRMRKVPEGATCADVLARRRSLLGV